MSISTVDMSCMPTHTRIKEIKIFNGVYGINGELLEAPHVELRLVRCWPNLDANNLPILNIFKQPIYIDSTLEFTYVTEDIDKLAVYLANIWLPMMEAGETLIANAISAGFIELPKPPSLKI